MFSPLLLLLPLLSGAAEVVGVPPPVSVDCSVGTDAAAAAEARRLLQEGQSLVIEQAWQEASDVLQRAVELDPLLALAHYGLGEARMAQGRFSEAVRAFDASRESFRCAATRPDAEKHRLRRALDDEIRELRVAIRNYDARRLRENRVGWKEANNDSETSGDRFRAARELERRLIQLEDLGKRGDGVPLGVTLALGTAHFKSGSLPDAEREFRAVLAIDPSSGDAHNNLAVVCMLTDRLDEAEREARAAEKAGLTIDPRLWHEIRKRRAR